MKKCEAVKISGLTKHYGDFCALSDLNLSVGKGEIFGLLGPNGSGKTTAIMCLLSLINYESGRIEIFGEEMGPASASLKSQIGIVPQDVAVFQTFTVYENIDYFCGLYEKRRRVRKTLVEDAIAFAGLEKFKNFKPHQLSGGLLRRLNLACGIAHKPRLIILDEPTVAVDPQSRNRILKGIQDLNKAGSTILYTTHYMEEVESICSKCVIMDGGKILREGTVSEIKGGRDVSLNEVFLDITGRSLRD